MKIRMFLMVTINLQGGFDNETTLTKLEIESRITCFNLITPNNSFNVYFLNLFIVFKSEPVKWQWYVILVFKRFTRSFMNGILFDHLSEKRVI